MNSGRPMGLNITIGFLLLPLAVTGRFSASLLAGELGGIAFLNMPVLILLVLAAVGL